MDMKMQKIKRQMEIETSIELTKIMCQLDHNSPKGMLDDWIKMYKKSELKFKFFNDKDVDLIIETLESLPGYSPERFIETGELFGVTELKNEEAFNYFLQIAYIYLSMVNPDLFEEASDAT